MKKFLPETIWSSDWTKYATNIVKKWDRNGLRFISDLYNTDTGKVYSREEINNIYGIHMTFQCYAALIRSIPQKFKEKIDKNI